MSQISKYINRAKFRMKLKDLFEGQKQPKIPKRPKKDLMFQSGSAWKADIATLHGQHVFARTQHNRPPSSNGKLYAVDLSKRLVYGLYDDSKDSGVVFFQPRQVTPGIKLELVDLS